VEVNDALKRFRAEFGLTQTQAAKFAGVSVAMYQFYEYGRHEPKVSALVALAKHCGVSLDYLTGLTDNPARNP
jgi:transcriptional regulator with XRE-family HTH domain